MTSSTSCPTATRTPWRRGSRPIPGSRWSAGTARPPTPRRRPKAPPQAEQVADRWHLLKNLREAVERVLERHSAAINAALKALEAPPGPDRDRDSPPDRRSGTGCRTAPASTAGRAGPGIATTPGQAGETSGAGRAVRASPRAPQARPPGRPDRPGTGPVAAVRVPVPAARDVPRLAPPGVAPVAAGRVPGVDRRPDRRGLHERRRRCTGS